MLAWEESEGPVTHICSTLVRQGECTMLRCQMFATDLKPGQLSCIQWFSPYRRYTFVAYHFKLCYYIYPLIHTHSPCLYWWRGFVNVNSRFFRSRFNLYFNERIDEINPSERLHENLFVIVKPLVYLTTLSDALAGIATVRMGIKSNLTWPFYRGSSRATCSDLGWIYTYPPTKPQRESHRIS